mmetsp:Transcript_192/g.515  ORF Transcript_192/g.515 Transcript_192/m.515 type:complete len:119 (-) Transcript_192:321-677(-)
MNRLWSAVQNLICPCAENIINFMTKAYLMMLKYKIQMWVKKGTGRLPIKHLQDSVSTAYTVLCYPPSRAFEKKNLMAFANVVIGSACCEFVRRRRLDGGEIMALFVASSIFAPRNSPE